LKATISGDQFNIDGQSLPILGGKKEKYREILSALYHQLNNMISHHHRLLVIRSDLHLYDYTADNKLISDFMRKLIKRLKSRYKINRLGYLWVRERVLKRTDKHNKPQHYHLLIMIDGSKVQHPSRIHKLIEEIWCLWDQPKPYTPKNSYYPINRGNTAQFNSAFERGSYLAKTNTKGNKAPTTNTYSSSRIKSKLKPMA